ncbi:MAG: acyltransferase [Breznakibacter sp.]|nr:acyltransferase [Breznakibacter sp.]
MSDPILSGHQPHYYQPVLFKGFGTVELSKNVTLGYNPSPFVFSGYCHIEARQKSAKISIGEGTYINNNATLIGDQSEIRIGKKCLIGPNFTIFDSDFHGTHPQARDQYKVLPVIIGDNVFIGANVTITKGVTIGDGCTIAAGAVVNQSFESNCIIGGNPAALIKHV